MAGIKLALQGYNFGNGYIDWAKQHGGYSEANAIEFSNVMAQKEGWSSYGDTQYAQHVLQYYSADGSAPGGMTGGDAQKLIEVTDTIKGTTHYVLGVETPGQLWTAAAIHKRGIQSMPRGDCTGHIRRLYTHLQRAAQTSDTDIPESSADSGSSSAIEQLVQVTG